MKNMTASYLYKRISITDLCPHYLPHTLISYVQCTLQGGEGVYNIFFFYIPFLHSSKRPFPCKIIIIAGTLYYSSVRDKYGLDHWILSSKFVKYGCLYMD